MMTFLTCCCPLVSPSLSSLAPLSSPYGTPRLLISGPTLRVRRRPTSPFRRVRLVSLTCNLSSRLPSALWEGIFSVIASLVILMMGLAFLYVLLHILLVDAMPKLILHPRL